MGAPLRSDAQSSLVRALPLRFSSSLTHPSSSASRVSEDLMFQLDREEFTNLRSQIVTSSWGGLRRATPYAFTEQGVAMLSSVLNSPKAIQVNVEIMRAFV